MSKTGEQYKSRKQMIKYERSERKKDGEMGYKQRPQGNGCVNRKSCK